MHKISKKAQIAALARLSVLDLFRRKDLVVVFILCAIVLSPIAFFAPFGVRGASRQMNELALLLIWTFSIFISIAVSSRLLPPEFESRTIYPLVSKPVSKGIIVLGKFIGAVSASLVALAFFYAAYAILIGLKGEIWFPMVMVQAFILHAGFVILACAVTLLGSLTMTPSANLTVSTIVIVTMLVFGSRIPIYATTQPQPMNAILTIINAVAPHFDFFDMRLRVVHNWPIIPWSLAVFVMLYSLAYSAVCLVFAAVTFKRKRY